MIDLHTHVLPGLDDGARDIDDSVSMAIRAAEDGVHTLVATPHIRDDYAVHIHELRDRTDQLSDELSRRNVPVRVLPGGEVAMSMAGELSDAQLRAVSLGGSSRYVLLETPYGPLPPQFEEVIFSLALRGVVCVIAHPERSKDIRADLGRLTELVRRGSLLQLTAGSVTGQSGREAERFALRLVRMQLVHCLASDSHRPGDRATLGEARRALARAGAERYAASITTDLPQRLLADESVRPNAPIEEPRRRWAWGRRRRG